jgi:hypothetical protein
VLEGTIELPGADEKRPAGLYVKHADKSGTAILVGRDGVTQFGGMQPDGAGFKVADRVDRQTALGRTTRFRLLLKHSLLEFYLDDHLIQCYSLPQDPTGRIAWIGGDAVRSLVAWQCGN